MPTADNDTLLIFRIAGIPCAVPAQSVDTIVMPPAHLTHPPGTGKSTPGIFRHSNQVHAVIDLHQRFGIDTPRQGMGRLLLNHEGVRHYAFWVDEVVGLVRSEEGKWAALPPYLPRTLFWSGFLYRKEIVLCTRLEDLRRMHDAAPLHLHLAALQPAPEPEKTEGKTENRREAKKEAPLPAPPRRDTGASVLSRPSAPKETGAAKAASPGTVSPSPTRPVTEARTDSTIPPPPPVTTAPSTPSASSPTPRPGPATAPRPAVSSPAKKTATTQKKAPPVAREVKPATPEPTMHQAAPPPAPESAALAPWLFLLFLLCLGIGGYVLWPDTIATLRPSPLGSAPATTAADTGDKPDGERSAPTPEVMPGPPPPPATTGSPAAETPAQRSADRPLRIERDDKGTISLIIDRAAIQAQAPAAGTFAPPADEGAAITDTPLSARPPAAAEEQGATEPPTTIAEPEAEEAQPLQPDPDWPAPIPAGVQPCDCTHIVVKGDTLWDIAQHYTRDAFNYHELARRSGIRNPDRIYPGDKVRIIIR